MGVPACRVLFSLWIALTATLGYAVVAKGELKWQTGLSSDMKAVNISSSDM